MCVLLSVVQVFMMLSSQAINIPTQTRFSKIMVYPYEMLFFVPSSSNYQKHSKLGQCVEIVAMLLSFVKLPHLEAAFLETIFFSVFDFAGP